jgi:hypothetical protein
MQNLAVVSKNFNQTRLSVEIDSVTNHQYGVFSAKAKEKQ